jgi:hypothetical protein
MEMLDKRVAQRNQAEGKMIAEMEAKLAELQAEVDLSNEEFEEKLTAKLKHEVNGTKGSH